MAAEPASSEGQSEDLSVHVRDYTRFTRLLGYSAGAALVIALFVLLIL